MKILHLTLKGRWYDMIASGEKLEEYREIKDHWAKRLADMHVGSIGGNFMDRHVPVSFTFKPFTHILFRHGYAKDARSMTIECKGITIGTGKPEWGAEPGKEYFIIKLGKQLKP